MRKVLLTMLLLAIVTGVSYAEFWICKGTAMVTADSSLGEGWKVTLKYFSYCTGVTTSTSYFYVSSKKTVPSTEVFLIFSKTGEDNRYSNWFPYTSGIVYDLGTFIVRNDPPPPQR